MRKLLHLFVASALFVPCIHSHAGVPIKDAALTGNTTATTITLIPGSAPSVPAEGALYYDSGMHAAYLRGQTGWQQFLMGLFGSATGDISMNGHIVTMSNYGSNADGWPIYMGDGVNESTAGNHGGLYMQSGNIYMALASQTAGGNIYMQGGYIYGLVPGGNSTGGAWHMGGGADFTGGNFYADGGVIHLGSGSTNNGGSIQVDGGNIFSNYGSYYVGADVFSASIQAGGPGGTNIMINSGTGGNSLIFQGEDGSTPTNTTSPITWYHYTISGTDYWTPLYQ